MVDKNLSELRQIAFEITIEPSNKVHAANAEDVAKVINAYVASYKSYLAIKLKSSEKNEDEINEIVSKSQLLIVDTNFNSYHSCMAPYSPAYDQDFFSDYKKDIIHTDINNYNDFSALRDKFTKDQLHSIYNPLFQSLNDRFRLTVVADGNKRSVHKPKREYASYFKKSSLKSKSNTNDKLYQLYVKSGDLKNISDKNILFSEELEHETYPFKLSHFVSNDKAFILNDEIICEVEYNEGLYFIFYPDLHIEVWGETRDEAEKAFEFVFYSLYVNYVLEDDTNLTDDAIILKDKINTMIRSVR